MDINEQFEITSHSDIGRRRTRNEDSSVVESKLGLLVIADGMGGYRAGDVASKIATSTIVDYVRRRVEHLKPQQKDAKTGLSMAAVLVRDAIHEANEQICLAAKQKEEYQGMGTTALVLLFYDDHFSVAHVGDSRLYRQRHDRIEQITQDHTLMQEMIDRGLYSELEAEEKTPRNLVTRALGVKPEVNVDVYEDEVQNGDLFLLCSDGLSDMVTDKKIEQALIDYTYIDQAALALVDLANLHGGKDNISTIIARSLAAFPATNSWINKIIKTK